jgi:hypothetical protein
VDAAGAYILGFTQADLDRARLKLQAAATAEA